MDLAPRSDVTANVMDNARLVRAKTPRVMDSSSGLWLLAAGDDACFVEGDSGDLLRAILAFAERPVERDAIVAHVIELAEGTDASRATVTEAIALLVRFGALVPETAPRARGVGVTGGHIVVGVTGAIGALATPWLVAQLVAASHGVRVAMTRSARRFVTARGFEALTHNKVLASIWSGTARAPSPHIELAAWADVVVIHPCTATTLSRIANGDCSDLVSAIAVATRAKVLIVPSMNASMLASPLVQANLTRVIAAGFFVAHPGHAVEVADAPSARVARGGGASPAEHVVRYASILLERAAADGPHIATLPEWEAEYAREPVLDEGDRAADEDMLRALDAHAASRSRVLDIGSGDGTLARAASPRAPNGLTHARPLPRDYDTCRSRRAGSAPPGEAPQIKLYASTGSAFRRPPDARLPSGRGGSSRRSAAARRSVRPVLRSAIPGRLDANTRLFRMRPNLGVSRGAGKFSVSRLPFHAAGSQARDELPLRQVEQRHHRHAD